jgi:hypothetical protein
MNLTTFFISSGVNRISVKTRILDPETDSSVELMALDYNSVDPHVRFPRALGFRKFYPDPDLTPDLFWKLGQVKIGTVSYGVLEGLQQYFPKTSLQYTIIFLLNSFGAYRKEKSCCSVGSYLNLP